MRRRADIKPNHIMPCNFSAKAELFDNLNCRQRWRARPRPARSSERGNRQSGGRGHGVCRPMARLMRRRLQRHRHHLRRLVFSHRRFTRRPDLVTQQPVHAFVHEPGLLPPDRGLGRMRCRHDRRRPKPVGAHQHDPGAPDMFLGRVAIRDPGRDGNGLRR